MIPVSRVPEPSYFDAEIRGPGTRWLASHPEVERPHPYWLRCIGELRDEFSGRCAYAAMSLFSDDTVDHFLSVKNHRERTYDWANYRYASSSINSMKKNADESILDPFEIGRGWFEILLPSLQMCCTKAIPPECREKAEYTLKRLKLRDGESMIRWRESWHALYRDGRLTLDGLRMVALLIAEAVERLTPVAPNRL